MNKKIKPSIKNNFLHLYKNQIKCISRLIFIIILTIIIYKNIDVFLTKATIFNKIVFSITIFLGFLFCYYLFKTMYHLFSYILNQRRIPLTKEELNNLNIKTQKEYEYYLYKYLHQIKPSLKIRYQIFLSFYKNFQNGIIVGDSELSINKNEEFLNIDIEKFDIYNIDNDVSNYLDEYAKKKFKNVMVN